MKIFKFFFKIILFKYFQSSIFNFKKIYSNNEFYKIRKIFNELKSLEFIEFVNNKSTLISNLPERNIFIKQIISNLLLKQPFIRIIFSKYYSSNKIIFPMPKEYQAVLVNNGFKVNFLLSTILWYFFVFYKIFKSNIFLLKYIFLNAISFIYKKKNEVNSIFFVDLNFANLSSSDLLNKKCNPIEVFSKLYPDISKFYINFNPKNKKNIHYNNKNVKLKFRNIYPFLNFHKFLIFFVLSFYYFFRSFYLIFTGQWWNAIILEEFLKYKIFYLSDNKDISKKYLFTNTSILFRPLWTYALKSRVSDASIFFYSLSYEPNCPKLNINTTETYFKNINWDNYYYWDNDHLNELKRYHYNKGCNFFNSGPILLGEFKNLKLPFNKKYISVFDIEPYDLNKYLGYSTYNDFGYSISVNYVRDFLENIASVAKEFDFVVLHKPKRKSSLRIKEYAKLLNDMQKIKNYFYIDESTNPLDLINISEVAISIPFTSTGSLALNQKIKSIYFDPNKIFNPKNYNNAVKLISGKSELYEFFNEQIY